MKSPFWSAMAPKRFKCTGCLGLNVHLEQKSCFKSKKGEKKAFRAVYFTRKYQLRYERREEKGWTGPSGLQFNIRPGDATLC